MKIRSVFLIKKKKETLEKTKVFILKKKKIIPFFFFFSIQKEDIFKEKNTLKSSS